MEGRNCHLSPLGRIYHWGSLKRSPVQGGWWLCSCWVTVGLQHDAKMSLDQPRETAAGRVSDAGAPVFKASFSPSFKNFFFQHLPLFSALGTQSWIRQTKSLPSGCRQSRVSGGTRHGGSRVKGGLDGVCSEWADPRRLIW